VSATLRSIARVPRVGDHPLPGQSFGEVYFSLSVLRPHPAI
jgi:hypothetical protein